MKNNVDFSRFGILDEEVLKKTRRLGKYYAYRQIDYQKVELSLFYLWKLIPEQDDDILCRISQIFSEVTKEQNAQLIWARLCVAAYYFFHDEPLWQDLVFRKLKERILLPDLVADVQTAKDLIDGYYKELALLSGAAPTPQVKPAPVATLELQRQASSTPKHKPEDVFAFAYQRTADYARLLQFLDAEKQDCTDLEWERYALAIFRCKKVFQKRPPTFTQWLPIFCDMFGRKVEYREPNKLDRGKNEKDITVFLSM